MELKHVSKDHVAWYSESLGHLLCHVRIASHQCEFNGEVWVG